MFHTETTDWAEETFGSCDLGGERRTKRLVDIGTRMKPPAIACLIPALSSISFLPTAPNSTSSKPFKNTPSTIGVSSQHGRQNNCRKQFIPCSIISGKNSIFVLDDYLCSTQDG
ncbi:MAG: IS4/Tn5 family transposase DNA-binding protein [Burkholderiaceae bacterium]